MKKQELKACPFCGSGKLIMEETTMYFVNIECRECGGMMTSEKSIDYRVENGHRQIKAEVIKAWNTRAKEAK